jgi:hypothetical protein
MNNTDIKRREDRREQVMYYRTEKFAPFVSQNVPQATPTNPPQFSSPWLVLYLFLKANLNRNSAS